MITINGIQFRNLEEQVAYNTALLNLFPSGIVGEKFQGIVSNVFDIEPGMVALVGDDTPFTLWYRPQAGAAVNLGSFPLEGPQGPTGPRGPKGEQGENGTSWDMGSELPGVGPAGELFLILDTGDIYRSNGTEWVLQGSIRGPQGAEGPRGPRGIQGITGPEGPRGPEGTPGMSYRISGEVESVGQLPNPFDGGAYIVGTTNKHLYVVVDGLWTDVGSITPQEIQILSEPGQSETAVMSQKATTEAMRISAAMGANGPKPAGNLKNFAYARHEGYEWRRTSTNADPVLIHSSGHTAYAVYLGENYPIKQADLFYHLDKSFFVQTTHRYSFTEYDRIDLNHISTASDYALREIRFTLPNNDEDDNYYISTLRTANAGDRSSAFTYYNQIPRRKYSQGIIDNTGIFSLPAQNLPIYFKNFELGASFMTGDGGLPKNTDVYKINIGNLCAATINMSLKTMTLSVGSEEVTKTIAAKMPVTGSVGMRLGIYNDKTILHYSVSKALYESIEINSSIQITGGVIPISLEASEGTRYSVYCYTNIKNWVIGTDAPSICNNILDNTILPVACQVNFEQLKVYIDQMLMSLERPRQIVFIIRYDVDQLAYGIVRGLYESLRNMGIFVSIASANNTTIQTFSERGWDVIDYRGYTNSTVGVAKTIENGTKWNRLY